MKFKMLTKTRLCACYLIAVRAFYMQMKCIHICIVYTVSSLMHPAPASQTDANQEDRMNFPSKVKHTILLYYSLESIGAAQRRTVVAIAPHAWHDCDLFATYVAFWWLKQMYYERLRDAFCGSHRIASHCLMANHHQLWQHCLLNVNAFT